VSPLVAIAALAPGAWGQVLFTGVRADEPRHFAAQSQALQAALEGELVDLGLLIPIDAVPPLRDAGGYRTAEAYLRYCDGESHQDAATCELLCAAHLWEAYYEVRPELVARHVVGATYLYEPDIGEYLIELRYSNVEGFIEQDPDFEPLVISAPAETPPAEAARWLAERLAEWNDRREQEDIRRSRPVVADAIDPDEQLDAGPSEVAAIADKTITFSDGVLSLALVREATRLGMSPELYITYLKLGREREVFERMYLGREGRVGGVVWARSVAGAVTPVYTGSLSLGGDVLEDATAAYALGFGAAGEVGVGLRVGFSRTLSFELGAGVQFLPGRSHFDTWTSEGNAPSQEPLLSPPRGLGLTGVSWTGAPLRTWHPVLAAEAALLGVAPYDPGAGQFLPAAGGAVGGVRLRAGLLWESPGALEVHPEILIGAWASQVISLQGIVEVPRAPEVGPPLFAGAGLTLAFNRLDPDGYAPALLAPGHDDDLSGLQRELPWYQFQTVEDITLATDRWFLAARGGGTIRAAFDEALGWSPGAAVELRGGAEYGPFGGLAVAVHGASLQPTVLLKVGVEATGGADPIPVWAGVDLRARGGMLGAELPIVSLSSGELRVSLDPYLSVGLTAEAPWSAGLGVSASGWRYRSRVRR